MNNPGRTPAPRKGMLFTINSAVFLGVVTLGSLLLSKLTRHRWQPRDDNRER